MTSFDLVLVMVIGDATQQALIGDDFTIGTALVAVTWLVLLDVAFGYAKSRWAGVDRMMDGLPVVLVDRGTPLLNRMAKEGIDIGDILAAGREQHGLRRVSDIDFAVLERSGGLSIIPGKRHVVTLMDPVRLTLTLRFLKRAVAAWWNDNAIRLGASLSYYTLFALAPMLLVAIAIAGSAFGEEAVRGEIVGQVNGLIGNEGGVAVQALLKGAALRGDSTLATIIGSITFFFAACGAFLELQSAFNTIWRVTPSPSNGGQIKDSYSIASGPSASSSRLDSC